MSGQVLGVGLASAYLKQLIESDDLLSDCWIEGEITELFQSRQGHVYFTLCEGQTTLKTVMFRGHALRQRRAFQAGEQVVAHGRFSIYEQQGRYQLIADAVQPAGLGIQALQFELLRQKLEAEGLFEESRKRQLPASPRCIAVVTSADGAVWHDIQHVLRRRYPLAHLMLSPATVQGKDAPESIVGALERVVQDGRADVVIIGRGGGSADDLACFNDERVVRALFACPIPTVSAVGHETDWTLCDLVADLRAPTPSAAAEMVSPSVIDFYDEVDDLTTRLSDAAERQLADARSVAARLNDALLRQSPLGAIRDHQPYLEQFALRIAAAGHATIERDRSVSRLMRTRAAHAWSGLTNERHWRVSLREVSLRSLEPRAVLQRGYAVVAFNGDGTPARSVDEAKPGQSARISFSDGDLTATVESVHRAKPETRSTAS
jgi:exodeoxyribonuclease VII large subunit